MDKKIKVLLIDDESDFTKPMSFWLESKGYSVMAASDGKSGIRLVKEYAPNVIFLDLNMPVMDGLTALKKIRAINKGLPVIMISAYVEDQRVQDAIACGISGVFYKGKDFEVGLSLLEVALGKHKNLQDA